jgi:hypothetical protein
MVDLVAIQMAIGGLKTAKDIAKAAIGIRDGALLQAKIIELNEVILSAQSSALDAQAEQAAMLQRISNLEKQLAGFEKWDADKERYILTEAGPGVFAYIVKPEARGGELPHYLCTNCYGNRKASILQHMKTATMGDVLSCAACDTKNLIRHGYRPPQ